jgi:Holliday junction DNA helicase RuvA
MIGYLAGKVLDHSDGKLLVAVGSPETGGTVGYAVLIPENGSHIGLVPGSPVELFIHTHVREDALDLFGFRSAAEKDLFLTLLSVSGIGPKLSLNILSGAEPGQLITAILKADKAFLGRVPGIGKKTAERIVLELSDKIQKKMDAGVYDQLKPATGATAAGAASYVGAGKYGQNTLVRDAASALVGLGYREQDAVELLNKLMQEAETPPQKVEDLIRSALRQMA